MTDTDCQVPRNSSATPNTIGTADGVTAGLAAGLETVLGAGLELTDGGLRPARTKPAAMTTMATTAAVATR